MICIICNIELKKLGVHLVNKHQIDSLEYFQKYLNGFNICEKYKSGSSAKQIAQEIKKESNGTIKPIKKEILNFLRKNKIEIRNTSEATKCWVESTGGVWNKGLTKEEHPSIKLYADSRMGKNNPFFNTDPEKRIDSFYKRSSPEVVEEIRSRIGNILKLKYRNGEIIPWSVLRPEEHKICIEKSKIAWKKKMSENKFHYFPISAMERKLGEFLKELNVPFLTQQSFGYFNYDYVLPEHKIVIEYQGTYWHCDPRFYEKDYWHQKKKCFAHQIWEKDLKKKTLALEKQHQFVALWESDLRNLTNEEIKQHLFEIIQNSVNQTNQN